MPGSITHAYVYKKHHKNILGAIISDFLPFLPCFTWKETHDLKKAIAFKKYLKKIDKSSLWLAKGIISHIVLDNAADKNRRLAKQRTILNEKIKTIFNLPPEKLEFFSDMVLDIVMDDLIKRKNKHLPKIIESSVMKTNIELVAKHIADFYKKDQKEITRGLQHLQTINFNTVTSSIQEASVAYLDFYKTERKGLLTKMYGLYINKILRKNKKELIEAVNDSEKFLLLEIEGEKTNLHAIMNHLKDEHTFNQKVYI